MGVQPLASEKANTMGWDAEEEEDEAAGTGKFKIKSKWKNMVI
jgi:hypothetical protein